MSSLLAKAKVKLINARNDYKCIGQDDAFLDDCCYNLQQAIELALKYSVKCYGIRYIENHDIRAQLNSLKGVGVTVPDYDRLRILAEEINRWEKTSRYFEDFTESLDTVEEVFRICENVINFAEKIVVEQAPQVNEIPDRRAEKIETAKK